MRPANTEPAPAGGATLSTEDGILARSGDGDPSGDRVPSDDVLPGHITLDRTPSGLRVREQEPNETQETWLLAGHDIEWLFTVCCVAWLSMVLGLVFWTLAPMVGGLQPRVVLTGSMTPSINPGDVVLVARVKDPRALPEGRVAVVRDPSRDGGTYVHRVASNVGDGTLVTRGDANPSDDFPAVTPDRVVGQVLLVVPRVGLPMVWMHQHRYLPVGAVLAGTWLSLYMVVARRPRSQRLPAHVRAGEPTAGPLDELASMLAEN